MELLCDAALPSYEALFVPLIAQAIFSHWTQASGSHVAWVGAVGKWFHAQLSCSFCRTKHPCSIIVPGSTNKSFPHKPQNSISDAFVTLTLKTDTGLASNQQNGPSSAKLAAHSSLLPVLPCVLRLPVTASCLYTDACLENGGRLALNFTDLLCSTSGSRTPHTVASYSHAVSTQRGNFYDTVISHMIRSSRRLGNPSLKHD